MFRIWYPKCNTFKSPFPPLYACFCATCGCIPHFFGVKPYKSAIKFSRKQGSHASRPCVQARFLPTMAKNSFRGARTPHCGDTHNAPLNPAPAPSICRLRLTQKGEPPRAVLLPHSGGEENCAQSESDCVVFLKLTALSYRSTRKKDFAERFFAKRSGERFRRTVR